MDILIGIISGLLIFILGTCGFLFRHTLKSFFVDPSSNPKLFFESGKSSLDLRVQECSSMERSLDSRVWNEMDKELKDYGPSDLDPYLNPILAVHEFSYSAKMLNLCKKLYIDAKQEYLKRKLNSEIIKQKWIPIDIFIINSGSIATKSMGITITVSPNLLYPNTKIEENSAVCFLPPTGKERFDKSIITTPDFYLGKEHYQYLTVTNEGPVQRTIPYDLTNQIRQGKANRYKLDTFYVDTSQASEIKLEWHIYEDTLGKNGNHGVLRINVLSK